MAEPTFSDARSFELAVAAVGVAVAVVLAAAAGALVHGSGLSRPWLAATVASSAVLVFAMPASRLAQPWPVLGGNCLSALVGVAAGHLLGHGTLAFALAAGIAVCVMALTRCLHPPGAGAALAGVTVGWQFPLAPVGLDMVVLIACGCAFHRFTRHKYPHRAPQGELGNSTFNDEDLDAVLAELGETFDIDRGDLRLLLGRLEARKNASSSTRSAAA
jgi:CBS domain-containing membrane protein